MKFDRFNVEEGKEYIYLVMVEYKDKTLLKIGYTKTIEGRMDTYELHNPDIQLLKVREGSRRLEGYMHKRFEKYAYPKREEWFYYNEEIINGFDTLKEINFLDIDHIKNKIYDLLKPKTVGKLKKIYYKTFKDDIKERRINLGDLNHVIVNSFTYINEEIENFIDSLDYSEIPFEFDSSTRYQIIIPNPLSPHNNIFITLEQILGFKYLKDNLEENTIKLFIKTTSKNIKDEFYKRIDEKKDSSMKILKSFSQVDEEDRNVLARIFQKIAETCHYRRNYIAVNNKGGDLIPVFNDQMRLSEIRTLEIQQMDYNARFSTIK